jgi:hypothetical protein
MARPRQVNIRVPTETYDVLEAAVFVRRLRGLQDLLAPVLEQTAARLKREEAIRLAVSARRTANGPGS